MFMLENHLSTDQNRVVAEVQAAASVANFSLFLTGGAMRDMLGGFQIRDLDFTVEGSAPKLAKTSPSKPELALSRSMSGATPWSCSSRRRDSRDRHVSAGAIREDQRASGYASHDSGGFAAADFTVNAIALRSIALARAAARSGQWPGRLGRKELRTLYPTAFYDDLRGC